MNAPRTFTPEEASNSLPLVRRIVADILEVGNELRTRNANKNIGPEESVRRDRLARRLQELFDELEAMGCFYKDWSFEVGLVDFPASIDGEDVLLCWRSDEPELKYYHGIHDGYAGRKEIPVGYLRTERSPG